MPTEEEMNHSMFLSTPLEDSQISPSNVHSWLGQCIPFQVSQGELRGSDSWGDLPLMSNRGGKNCTLRMRPISKAFSQTKKILFFISLLHFNMLLGTWKGGLMPAGLPLLAASWMGDARSQGGCRLAPCSSSKFKQATLPLTQVLNSGVCQSTVTPFTWGKITQSSKLFCPLSISELMTTNWFLSRKEDFLVLFISFHAKPPQCF